MFRAFIGPVISGVLTQFMTFQESTSVSIIILILLFVRLSVSPGGHGKPFDPSKNVFLLCIAGVGRYSRQPTDTARSDTSCKLK